VEKSNGGGMMGEYMFFSEHSGENIDMDDGDIKNLLELSPEIRKNADEFISKSCEDLKIIRINFTDIDLEKLNEDLNLVIKFDGVLDSPCPLGDVITQIETIIEIIKNHAEQCRKKAEGYTANGRNHSLLTFIEIHCY
jgi:hypothetical protein